MIGLITWLTGSRIGQYVAMLVLIIALMSIAITLIYKKGYNASVANDRFKSLANALERINTDAKLEELTSDQRRAALNIWMRGTDK